MQRLSWLLHDPGNPGCEFPHRLLWILWRLLQNYYTTVSIHASKYLSCSKTCDVKLKSYNVIAKFLPLWWSICAEQLDPCKTEEIVCEGNVFWGPRRFLKVRRVGIAVPQSQELPKPKSLWCDVDRELLPRAGRRLWMPLLWKKKWKVFWWLRFGTCVPGILFSDLWRRMHVQTLLCMSLQCRSDRKKKRRSKKHFTETWSRTKSHKSSSASRIPEPCRRRENSGSIQRELFFSPGTKCALVENEIVFCHRIIGRKREKNKINENRKKAFYYFAKQQLLSHVWLWVHWSFLMLQKQWQSMLFGLSPSVFTGLVVSFLETGGHKCEWKNKYSVWLHLPPHP